MDVKAIVLIGGWHSAEAPSNPSLSQLPYAAVDVLGRPVVEHAIDRLLERDIESVSVIVESCVAAQPFFRRAARPRVRWSEADHQGFWRTASSVFSDLAQSGAELVLVHRIGSYVELNWEELLQFHFDRKSRVTAVNDEQGRLGVFLISASRRNDAAFLFRHRLEKCRVPCAEYETRGYVNRLRDIRDFRCLALDAFAQKNRLKPAGREVRPGVWVADGAQIHRGARVLAPAFIGARSKVRAAAVVTRCASLEHHTEVDCGTVVEDATLLPFTRIGAGLDVAHAVVGFHRLAHLRKKVEVEISDPKLVGMTSPYAPLRALGRAASLAAYLPSQILRGFFTPSQREEPASLPEAVTAPSHALAPSAAMEASDPGGTGAR